MKKILAFGCVAALIGCAQQPTLMSRADQMNAFCKDDWQCRNYYTKNPGIDFPKPVVITGPEPEYNPALAGFLQNMQLQQMQQQNIQAQQYHDQMQFYQNNRLNLNGITCNHVGNTTYCH